jgi:hypothetical protein
VNGISIHQIADGKILETTAVWDAIGMLEQLGVTLPLNLDALGAAR